MGLDVVWRFVTRHGPAVPPVTRRFNAPGFEPELERLGNDDRTGSVCRGGNVDERYELTRKRYGHLTEILGSHTPTVSDHEVRCKTPDYQA